MEELSQCLTTIKRQIELHFAEEMKEEDTLVRIRKFIDKNNNSFYVANWLKDAPNSFIEVYNDKDIFIKLTNAQAEIVDNLTKKLTEEIY